jgi:hypothetical protein
MVTVSLLNGKVTWEPIPLPTAAYGGLPVTPTSACGHRRHRLL